MPLTLATHPVLKVQSGAARNWPVCPFTVPSASFQWLVVPDPQGRETMTNSYNLACVCEDTETHAPTVTQTHAPMVTQIHTHAHRSMHPHTHMETAPGTLRLSE